METSETTETTEATETIETTTKIYDFFISHSEEETEEAKLLTDMLKKINPKFIIAIDALASSSIERINKTIQLTDTGIHPGSGIGNNRKEISFEKVGVPVIAIGVPTVVESSIIVSDTIYYLFKHLSYIRDNYDSNKLVFSHTSDYINKIKNKRDFL